MVSIFIRINNRIYYRLVVYITDAIIQYKSIKIGWP